MSIVIREYTEKDLPQMAEAWNEVVVDGNAFPQKDILSIEDAGSFFARQSFTGVAELDSSIVGLYILHPNSIGRCGHLSNASYAVKSTARGKGIGRELVLHSLKKGKELGFRILQFNAVVKSNLGAIRLYEQLGFVELGTIPGGFLTKDNEYEDIALYYHTL